MAIAIADIHGCLEPLQALIEQIPPDEELVFLGDYVDRGPDSAGVVRFLVDLAKTRRCVFLMGNHEAMLADAMARDDALPQWLFNGGEATLISYGIDADDWCARPAAQRNLPGFADFLARLRLYHEDADAIYVHAGIDVDVPAMEDQKRAVLLWVRERFTKAAGRWGGKPVVFGHTSTESLGAARGAVYLRPPLIGIDTGCVYGGNLTAFDTRTQRVWQVPGHTPAQRATA